MGDLTDSDHVAELWRLISHLGVTATDPTAPASDRTSGDVVVAVGPAEPGRWHVSLSHDDGDVAALARALGGTGVVRRAAAVHCAVRAGPPPPWTRGDYFRRGLDTAT